MKKVAMSRFLLITLGTLSLALGVIGIVVPGLPTTIFLLGAAACYVRSSERLYNWMLQHKVLGAYISNYRKYKAMPLKSKIIALIMMWTMISISVFFFIKSFTVQIIVIVSGIIGTIVILMVKTLRKEE
jgi:uncharacterized membrane protein YbaN (DUF454 family)